MELKSTVFPLPLLYTTMFHKSSKVARPLKNEPPFSALPHLESCAIKWNCLTEKAFTERSVEPNAARDIVPCRQS